MSCRFGLRGFGPGSLARRVRPRPSGFGLASWPGVFVAFALALGLAACDDEAVIALRPAELVDPAPEDPFDLDPLFAPARPACRDCRERRVELASGEVVTVRVADEPALVLRDEDIDFIELAEGAGSGAGSRDRFAVHVVLGEAGREAWAPFAAEHANAFLLVEIGGRPVDLVRPLGWTRGLRIGVFADELARAHFVESLPFAKH